MTPTVRRRWFVLLTPAQTTGVVLEGLDVVGGPVVPVEEATYADADAARAAFGHPDPEPGAGRFVDFLVLPELPGVEVVDGVLRETRAPSGAELWRLEADGRRRVISYYDTPAYGWRNGRGPVRPAPHVGLSARYVPRAADGPPGGGAGPRAADGPPGGGAGPRAADGPPGGGAGPRAADGPPGGGAGPRAANDTADYVAAFEEGVDGVHLVAVTTPGEDPPEGFTWTKVGVSRRTVPLADVELYDAATGHPFTP
ncbi:MAG: hypothetical protein PGN15_14320 [Aeromicrobium erythreum]